MALSRRFDGSDPVRPEPAGAGALEYRRIVGRSTKVGSGTLACPSCDAPVALAGPVAPGDLLGCPFCAHAGRVRDFLSLAAPTRPARVVVRIVV
jgi:hypothetical protein